MPTSEPKSSEYARSARDEKRAHAASIGVDESFVSQMVEHFYGSVRSDAMLAQIFDARITDWPEHLDRMKSFWRSVLFNSGEFRGNPQLKHITIPGLGEEHFAHWLELFYATLRELEQQPEGTQLVAIKARSIADSLLTAISIRRSGLAGAKAGKDLPYA